MRFRRAEDGGVIFWCPGCDEPHHAPGLRDPKGWFVVWQGVDQPSAQPSYKHQWTVLEGGVEVSKCCHYVLTAGVLHFQTDCTHHLKGKSVQAPDWPA